MTVDMLVQGYLAHKKQHLPRSLTNEVPLCRRKHLTVDMLEPAPELNCRVLGWGGFL